MDRITGWTGWFLGLCWRSLPCLGTLTPRRFASGDGEGPELIAKSTLRVGVPSASSKMDTPRVTHLPPLIRAIRG